MSDLLFATWMLACLYILISFIKPLPPFKTRLRTLVAGVPAAFVSLFAIGLIAVWNDPKLSAEVPKPSTKIAATDDVKHWQTAGFPDQASFEIAKKIGLPRFGAYRLLRDNSAIAEYCDWLKQSSSITKQANKKFGDNPSGEQYGKKNAWERQQQDELNQKKQTKLGIDFNEGRQLAMHGSWRVHCAANEVGWIAVNRENAGSLTKQEASSIRDALYLHYINRLERSQGNYFNNKKYSLASCHPRTVGKFRVIGCRLMDYGIRSKYDYFVAAKTEDGKLAAASIERNRHLTDLGEKTIIAPTGDTVHLARITDPQFDRTNSAFDIGDIDEAFGVTN